MKMKIVMEHLGNSLETVNTHILIILRNFQYWLHLPQGYFAKKTMKGKSEIDLSFTFTQKELR